MSSEQVNLLNVSPQATTVAMVSIREIACYLSMLEGGKVEDKLECKDIKEALFVEEGYGFVAIQYTVIAIVALKRR